MDRLHDQFGAANAKIESLHADAVRLIEELAEVRAERDLLAQLAEAVRAERDAARSDGFRAAIEALRNGPFMPRVYADSAADFLESLTVPAPTEGNES